MLPSPAPQEEPVAASFSRRFEQVRVLAKARERRLFALGSLCLAVAAWLVGWAGFAAFSSVWPGRLLLLALPITCYFAFRKHLPQRLFLSLRLSTYLKFESPGLGSGLTSATELAQAPRGSEALVKAHLRWAQSVMDDAFVTRQLNGFFAPLERRTRQVLSGLVLFTLLASLLGADASRRYARQLLLNDDSEWATFPIVGDLSLTLRSPAYTGIAPREVRGGDGTIRALRGTTVVLRATAEQNVRTAELRIGGADGTKEGDKPTVERIIPLAVTDGRQLLGEFVLDRSERYRFVLRPFFGTALKERRGHAISVQDDKPPKLELQAPLEDLELKETGRVMFRYDAEDDFGIAELALVYKVGAKEEQRVPLSAPAQRAKFHGDYAFDLAPLGLRPGDEVSVFIEAKDNDTVSGAKKGVTPTRRIKVFSADEHRRELLAKLRDLMDRFVDILADELENPVTTDLRAYAQQSLVVDDHAGALIADLMTIGRALLASDEKTRATFGVGVERSAKDLAVAYSRKREADTMQGLQRGLLEAAQSNAIALLERTIVYFEDLRGLASVEEIKALASEISKTSQDLKQLLAKYKETRDPTLKTALEAEIGSLRERLNDIQKKMAELQRGMGEGFVNKEAFERNQVQNTLESLEQLLAEDRLDELATELERLSNQLDNMSQRIDKADKEFGEDRYAGVRQEIQEFQQKFEAVEQAEKQALAESEKLEQQYREEVQRRMGENLEALVKATQSDLDAAEKKLADDPPEARVGREPELAERVSQRITDSRRALDAKDFLETRDMLRDSVRSAADLLRQLRAEESLQQAFSPRAKPAAERRAHAEQASERLNKALDRIEKLFPDPREVMSQKQMQQMQQLQQRQQEISRQTRQLGEKMQQINQQAPIFDESAQQDMGDAAGDMDRAGNELGQGQSARAGSAQRSALGKLKKMRDQMQQQNSGSGEGQGVPRPFGGLPNPMGQSGGDPSQEDKVEIPSGEAFRVPPEFRRDILDAMKQGAPEEFKQQVEEFYRELIK